MKSNTNLRHELRFSLAIFCLAVMFAVSSNSALAWQVVEPVPEEAAPVAPNFPADMPTVEPDYDSYPEEYVPQYQSPQYQSTWFNGDFTDPMYDTSLIPRWNRLYPYEGAAGIPPYRSMWTPSAITGQLVWSNRTGAEQSVLLTSGVLNAGTGLVDHTTAVSTSNLLFPVEAGVRMSVLFGKPRNWLPEFAYLGIFDQNTTVNFAPTAALGVVETGFNFFDLALTTPVTEMSVSYESDLHSTEMNFWYDDEWLFQPLVGFRWIQQAEELEQFETQNWDNRTIADCTNNLIGAQLGFRSFFFERGKLSAFVIGKGGVFYNQVHLLAALQSGGVSVASFDLKDESTAFAGEINLTANWQLTPYCNIHFGYTGLWLTEVVVVGDQLNDLTFAAGGGTFDFGGVSYQGGHFGVTFAW